MKHIFLNLKRLDIPKEYGGVNSISEIGKWGEFIVSNTQDGLNKYDKEEVEFVMYMPEAHLIPAIGALKEESMLKIGSQGVYRDDTSPGVNFGAFTTNRTGNAMKAMGCTGTIIGHCEERNDKLGIMKEAGVEDTDAVNRILNKEVKAAISAGLTVLYCIGETAVEQVNWQEVLRKQLSIGLEDVDLSKVTIAYEPVWAIGPGKTPPDSTYIQKIAKFIKKETNGLSVTYGGGDRKSVV